MGAGTHRADRDKAGGAQNTLIGRSVGTDLQWGVSDALGSLAESAPVRIFCDESGFSGNNLLDRQQPYFVYAAVAA